MLIWWIKQFSRLPFSWQIAFAKFLAPIARLCVKRRMKITEVNLSKCFPDKSSAEIKHLAKKSFESFVIGAVEAVSAWCMPPKRFNKIKFKITGLEHIDAAKKEGHGVILCGFHFHTLEITGRQFGEVAKDFGLVYQKHPNPEFDNFLVKARSQYATRVFKRKELKAMLKWLKEGNSFWYAPDQDFGPIPSVFAPFFGIQTATLNAPAKMADRTDAKLCPFLYARVKGGYELTILPALDNYPSGDDVKDATRLNRILESHILKYPEQYLWQHRRFKTRPDGEGSFYT